MNLVELIKRIKADMAQNPYRYWAKSSDDHVHMVKYGEHATMCGKWKVLLGNNYAPTMIKLDFPICADCLQEYQKLL